MAERINRIQEQSTTDRIQTVTETYSHQLNRLERYKNVDPVDAANFSVSLRKHADLISDTTFIEIEEDARDAGLILAYSVNGNKDKGYPDIADRLKGKYAHGLGILAVNIMADEEMDNLQKQKELTWIHDVAGKLRNRTIGHLTEMMLEDIPLSPKEKFQKFKEETEFKVRNWIQTQKEDLDGWKKSPLAQKLVVPAEFVAGAAIGFVAAEKAPQVVNSQTAVYFHSGLIALRASTEAVRVGVRELEFRHPKIAALSQKIASHKVVQKIADALEHTGLESSGNVETVSDMLEVFGKGITKFQTSAAVIGATAGVIAHTGVDYIKANSHQTQQIPETKAATPAHQIEKTEPVTNSQSLTPSSVATAKPEQNATQAQTTVPQPGHETTPTPENHHTPPLPQNQPETVPVPPGSENHILVSVKNDSGGLENYALRYFGDANGNGAVKILMENIKIFTDPSRPSEQREAAMKFYEYVRLHPDMTLAEMWNENVRLGHVSQLNIWFTKGFRIIPQFLNGQPVNLSIPLE